MKWWLRMLAAWSDRLPARRICGENGEPYLMRYYVGRVFGTSIYLHRFLASDPDRGFHNHPWEWCGSLVLAGWYLEELFNAAGVFEMRPRRAVSWAAFDHRHLHRVVVMRGVVCWSLFFCRAKTQKWGFLRQHGAVAPGAVGPVWSYQQYMGSPADDWYLSAPKGRDLLAD